MTLNQMCWPAAVLAAIVSTEAASVSTLQLDLGANLGLDRFTPDAQVSAGISTRS